MTTPSRIVLSLKRSAPEQVSATLEERLHKVLASCGFGSRPGFLDTRALAALGREGEGRDDQHETPYGRTDTGPGVLADVGRNSVRSRHDRSGRVA